MSTVRIFIDAYREAKLKGKILSDYSIEALVGYYLQEFGHTYNKCIDQDIIAGTISYTRGTSAKTILNSIGGKICFTPAVNRDHTRVRPF